MNQERKKNELLHKTRELRIESQRRKSAEQNLQEAEARYRSVLDAVPDPVTIYDMAGQVRHINPAFTIVFGWSLDELEGKRIDFVPEENRPETDDAIQRMLKGETIQGLETRRFTKDGRILDILGSSSTFMGLDGNPSGIVVILRDVSEKKYMEETLKENEERYRSVMEAAPDPMVVYNMDGEVNYLNPAFTRVFGWQLKDLVNRKIDFIPPECWPETNMMIRKAVSGEDFSGLATRRYTKDKKILDISMSAATWRSKNGTPVGSVVNLRDVTQRKQMEEERIKSGKLESLGILAGGIAHDFNNLLSVIVGSIDLSKMATKPDSMIHKNLTTAHQACMNAMELTNRFLTFSKGGFLMKELRPLADIIQSATVRALEDTNICCDFSIPEDLWYVEFDKGQINQVIANLIQNAKDAMPQSGTIKVGAENIDLKKDKHHLPFKKGDYVKIYFQDEGRGIPREQLPKIFDPYFSTKDLWAKKGMGLGLATVFSIIKRHDGYIQVDSEVDVGTTFSVFLPASPEAAKVDYPR